MADEQPNTLSADVTTSDVEGASSSVSDEPSQQESSGGHSWWDRLMGRDRRETQETERDSGERSTGGKATSEKLTLSEEELQRRIQSEADRREAKRVADLKVQQRRELRDRDPWAFAEQERKEEELQTGTSQLTDFVTRVGTEHDRAAIDPVVELLPKEERDRIFQLEGAGRGLEGRKLVVTEALKALEKHWKSEGAKGAEDRLRRNPAFRKQLLSEARGGTVEPELLPAAGPSAADQTVSSILRKYYDLPAPSQHNSAS